MDDIHSQLMRLGLISASPPRYSLPEWLGVIAIVAAWVIALVIIS